MNIYFSSLTSRMKWIKSSKEKNEYFFLSFFKVIYDIVDAWENCIFNSDEKRSLHTLNLKIKPYM